MSFPITRKGEFITCLSGILDSTGIREAEKQGYVCPCVYTSMYAHVNIQHTLTYQHRYMHQKYSEIDFSLYPTSLCRRTSDPGQLLQIKVLSAEN